ncbi:hypothetical protein DICSQDRAFT_184126 [Dichomitus squalens LYAD-421 SS1]|uniref:Uncharacterized protein n=1 Tax=Dichomitus squalens (strain LYAD-421) TaxID=732165 RepID=R7SI86_DICSQ|nr:uncharacterized protein DICSQDRAFT_184126 [Dichomitus squalens LYAD-421 SS1]EJF55864.1 hypothetical protein DICSQDRAFT_184126 [Dichomitus squalens LYAD-421 SS1]
MDFQRPHIFAIVDTDQLISDVIISSLHTMSDFDPSASLTSLATTNTGGTATPTASTAHLLPAQRDGSSSVAPGSTASSSQTLASSTHLTTAPRSQTYPSSSNTPPKDYEKAFATLSSQWGWGGTVSAKNPKSEKGKKEKKDKKEKRDKKDKKKDKT